MRLHLWTSRRSQSTSSYPHPFLRLHAPWYIVGMAIDAEDKAQNASIGAFRALAGTITQAVSQEAAFVLARLTTIFDRGKAFDDGATR